MNSSISGNDSKHNNSELNRSNENLANANVETKGHGLRQVIVEEHTDSELSSADEVEEDEKEPEKPQYDIPQEYWHIQKLIKYIKTGNQIASQIGLCCLIDHDLTLEINQLAIQHIGGLEILINLLEVDDMKSKIGALEVLRQLTVNQDIRRAVTDLGGIKLLVQNLAQPLSQIQTLVAENIYNLGRIQKARAHIRKFNGIGRLVALLDVNNENILKKHFNDLASFTDRQTVQKVESVAKALWSISNSNKNVTIIMKTGSVPLLSKLLKTVHRRILIPVCGTLARCSIDNNYRIAIQSQGMIEDIVKHLANEEHPEIKRHCAEVIFRCSELPKIRNSIKYCGGLDPLVQLAKDPKTKTNKALLAAVTGAIWKTAISPENVERYDQLKTVEILVKLLDNVEEDEDVLCNVVGALSQFMKYEHNRRLFVRLGGVPPLVNLLNYSYHPLLINVPLAIKECAIDDDCMRIIESMDGVRLIWSLLKNESSQVQSSAALSLVPCIRHAIDSGEMVRSFVGGLELIVKLLNCEDIEVLASVCAAISEIAKDIENLAIITDHGVVPMLVQLLKTPDNVLREHLSSAIASCCAWGSNCKVFGRLGAIIPLVQYMADDDPNVHRTAALALFHLSDNPFNCITMHESGIVPFLFVAIDSKDKELQDAAAGCLANIRKLALTAETDNLVRAKVPFVGSHSDSESD